MIISNIVLSENKQDITLSASVQFAKKKSERMYFSTSIENKKALCTDATPFLATVLLPCMKTKENILIKGSVSLQFLENTKNLMRLVQSWNVGLTEITITAEEIKKDTGQPDAVACFFSAGVDSFYTYLKNKNTITDFILVHGFDIPLQNEKFFQEVATTVEQIATETKVNALIVKTNVADIIENKLVWDFAHGGALAAVGLFLRKNLKTLYISGAVRHDELFPYGTHPDMDKFWSTETLTVVHEGAEYNRLDKIINIIAKSPLALQYLRVCTQNINGHYNCSRCFKCLTTMIYLVCANALDKAKTFDKKIDLEAVKNMYYDYTLLYNQQGEVSLAYLKEHNREQALQEAIAYSLEKSKRPSLKRMIAQKVASFDQRYNDRRFYRFIFQVNHSQDRNIFFKFLLKRGLLK